MDEVLEGKHIQIRRNIGEGAEIIDTKSSTPISIKLTKEHSTNEEEIRVPRKYVKVARRDPAQI